MSKITHDNLDKWLFNLNEGNLSSSEKRELDSFLSQHPEYNLDADAWNSAEIKEDLAPYQFEAELHAIAGNNTIYAYRKWAAAAGLLLLLGGSAFYYFFNSNDSNSLENSSNNFGQTKKYSNDNTHTHSTNDFNHKGQVNSSDNAHSNSEKSNLGENNYAENNSTNYTQNGSQNSNVKTNFNLNNHSQNENLTELTNNSNHKSNSKNSINNKTRKQVSINIKNEITIKTEKSIEYLNEPVAIENNNTEITNQDLEFAKKSEEKAKLAYKENVIALVISENKTKNNPDKRRKVRYKLDPNPSFTNLRDPQLLMTNNHLIDQYAGFSGSMISSRFSTNYRNTWTGNENINSQTMLVSYDKLLRKLKTGIGFTALYNNYGGGMYTTMGAALSISPKFKLGRGTSIEPAITFSYAQKNANTNRTIPGTFIEDQRGNVLQIHRNGVMPAATSAYMPDLKMGAVLQTKKFWVATSIDHLLTPKETLYTTETNLYKNEIEFKATLGSDYLHRPESGNVVSPQVSFYYHDGYTEMWLGTNVRLKQFTIGASLSQFQDYIATVGFQTPSLKMFYQFDMTRSLLMNEKFASHEIGLRFAINGNNRGSKSILNNER